MKKILILQGIPGSGKTTFAREFVKGKTDWVRINRDDLRNMRGDYWIPNQEKMITIMEEQCLIAALSGNYNVIYDSTNLNPKTIKRVQDIVNISNNIKKSQAFEEHEIEFKLFDTPLDVCIERDKNRDRSVGAGVITNFYNKYIKND